MKTPSSRMIAKYEKHPQHPSRWRGRRRSYTVSAVVSALVIGVPCVWGAHTSHLNGEGHWVLGLAALCSPLVMILSYDVARSWWHARCLQLIWTERPEWAWETLKSYHQERVAQSPEKRELRKKHNKTANVSLILLLVSAVITASAVGLAMAYSTSTAVLVSGLTTGTLSVVILMRMVFAMVSHSRLNEQIQAHEQELRALRDMSHELPDDALLVGALSEPMDAQYGAISAVFE